MLTEEKKKMGKKEKEGIYGVKGKRSKEEGEGSKEGRGMGLRKEGEWAIGP